MKPSLRCSLPLALFLLGSLRPSPAAAHDFWMMPAELVVPADREVALSLFVGEAFVAEDEKRFDRARVASFTHRHAGSSGEAEIDDVLAQGRQDQAPVARLMLRGAGGHLLAMDRLPTKIELAAARFEDYLRHEGMAAIVAERARLGESDKPGRERYSRYLKTLVQVGDARDDIFGLVTGAALELVPEQDPVFAAPGSQLAVRVLFRGQPLPGARLEVLSRDGADVRSATATAGADGRARVTIDRRGVWLLRMVHIVRCEGCADADWESFWTSYSFASSQGPGVVVAAPSMRPPPTLPTWLWIVLAGGTASVLFGGTAYWRRRPWQGRGHAA